MERTSGEIMVRSTRMAYWGLEGAPDPINVQAKSSALMLPACCAPFFQAAAETCKHL